MKKKLALILASSFLAAVAFAEDTSSSTTYERETMTQQNPVEPSRPEATQETMKEKRASSDKAWKDAKTCTDKNGIVFKKGKDGFERCMEQKRQQMGGELGVPYEMPADTE